MTPPVAGVSVNVTPVSGAVLIRAPGTAAFVNLTAGEQHPWPVELDTTRGRVRLASAAGAGRTQTADFYQGRAKISQSRTNASRR